MAVDRLPAGLLLARPVFVARVAQGMAVVAVGGGLDEHRALAGATELGGTVDRVAEAEYEKLFQRALVTFALARTLNGLISAVQGTELALQPAGVGVTLTPGEILDPVNDLVERFSWIMLGATLSLGVQQVLLDIGQWWVLKALVAVLALAWIGVSWRRNDAGASGGSHAWLWRALIVVLLLRFAVPLAMIVNEAVYDLFLEGRYVESTAVIESAEADIEVINEAASATAEDESVFDALGRTFDSTRQSLDFRQKLASISERATDLIDKYFEVFPHMNFPYDYRTMYMLSVYFQAGAYDKAKPHLEILARETADRTARRTELLDGIEKSDALIRALEQGR